MKRTQVAIIGAGLAGLCAARSLRTADINLVLIEARDRLGGRILTVGDTKGPADGGFDLGPSWFWPKRQPAFAALLAELGLPTFERNSDGDIMFERMSREFPSRYRGIGEEQQSMRLVGGTETLVRALARDLSGENIQLGARVTAMGLGDDGVELTISRADGTTEKLTAGHVIAALPPRLLEATVSFTPGQKPAIARRWRNTPTWMAPHAKFFALYDRPFWRDVGLSGTAQSVVGPMVEMHDASSAFGGAALFGFLGLAAEQRAAFGEANLTRACLDQFVRIFGADARNPHGTLFKDWAVDPLTATATDCNPGVQIAPSSAPWVAGPWKDVLALGGSETSPTEPGYLAGAVCAANRAVASTLRKLRQSRHQT